MGGDLELERLALNMEQVNEYQPPPNPAKLTDARAARYVREYGYDSWELDALEPQVLASLVSGAVESYIDMVKWGEVKAQEEEQRALLTQAQESLR